MGDGVGACLPQAAARVLSAKDGKIDALMQEVMSLRNSLRDRERTISSFHAHAESLIHVDSKFLDVAVKDMYAQVVLGVGKSGKKLKAKPLQEVGLAASVSALSAVASGAAAGAGGKAGAGLSATAGPGRVGLGSTSAPSLSTTLPAADGTRSKPRQDAISIKEHQETVDGAWGRCRDGFEGSASVRGWDRLACGMYDCVCEAEIVRQKEFVHQSESILKRQLGYTTKALSRKAQLATDDNILLIQYVGLVAPASGGSSCRWFVCSLLIPCLCRIVALHWFCREINDLRKAVTEKDRRIKYFEMTTGSVGANAVSASYAAQKYVPSSRRCVAVVPRAREAWVGTSRWVLVTWVCVRRCGR